MPDDEIIGAVMQNCSDRVVILDCQSGLQAVHKTKLWYSGMMMMMMCRKHTASAKEE